MHSGINTGKGSHQHLNHTGVLVLANTFTLVSEDRIIIVSRNISASLEHADMVTQRPGLTLYTYLLNCSLSGKSSSGDGACVCMR